MAGYVALGELSLDAAVTPVAGALNAAMAAIANTERPKNQSLMAGLPDYLSGNHEKNIVVR